MEYSTVKQTHEDCSWMTEIGEMRKVGLFPPPHLFHSAQVGAEF